MLRAFIEYLSGLYLKKEVSPAVAYDLWASTYDTQPGSLMMDFDEEVFHSLLKSVDLKDKIIADIGCGTGRHWKKMLEQDPKQLIGYEVSVRMLNKLKEKFPKAVTHLMTNHRLHSLDDTSCDVLVSNLTISHIEDLEQAFKEWDRVLKPAADILITESNPELLAKGEERVFTYRNKTITIRSFVHPVEKIRAIAKQLNWQESAFTEKFIDDSVKEYYENQYALSLYEKFKGTSLVYGIHFKKDSSFRQFGQ